MVSGFARLFRDGVRRLEAAGADAPQFACRCLLEHVFRRPAASLLCSDDVPGDGARAAFFEALEKYAGGYPLQYIVGDWEFLSLPVRVEEGVLIPRPDTETLALTAIAFLESAGADARFLELGSGSGCVCVALAKRTGRAGVAVDVSEKAVRLTRENARRNGVDGVLDVRRADLFDFYAELPDGSFALIVSNPPYLSDAEMADMDPSIRREPREALAGGADGLDFYRFIAAEYADKLRPGGRMCFEIGYRQAAAVSDILRQNGYEDIRTAADLGGNDRVVSAMRAGAANG